MEFRITSDDFQNNTEKAIYEILYDDAKLSYADDFKKLESLKKKIEIIEKMPDPRGDSENGTESAFGAYLMWLSVYRYLDIALKSIIPGAIIAFVLSVISEIVLLFAGLIPIDNIGHLILGALLSTVAGAVGLPVFMLVVRPIAGIGYGTALCFVGIPIYLFVYRNSQKELETLYTQYSDQKKKIEGEIKNSQIKKEISAKILVLKREADEYKKRFDSKIAALLSKFMFSDKTDSISRLIKRQIDDRFERISSSRDAEVLEFIYSFEVTEERVCYDYSERYDFNVNRCARLEEFMDKAAMARAIAEKVIKKLTEERSSFVKKDISFKVFSKSENESKKVLCEMYISVINPNFQPLETWESPKPKSESIKNASV